MSVFRRLRQEKLDQFESNLGNVSRPIVRGRKEEEEKQEEEVRRRSRRRSSRRRIPLLGSACRMFQLGRDRNL